MSPSRQFYSNFTSPHYQFTITYDHTGQTFYAKYIYVYTFFKNKVGVPVLSVSYLPENTVICIYLPENTVIENSMFTGGVLDHLLADGVEVAGVVGEVGAEEEAGGLEAVEDGGQVGLGAGLQAAEVGGQHARDLRVEGAGTVALPAGRLLGRVDHHLKANEAVVQTRHELHTSKLILMRLPYFNWKYPRLLGP